MIIEKSFAYYIDTDKPITFCEGDYEENVMKHTIAAYKGKCYKNMYITGIKSITHISDPVMSKSSLEGIAQIAVAFIAEGIIINKDDIIVDTIISDKGHNNIIVKSSSCTGNVTANQLLQSFVQGERLPVTVIQARYPANDNYIRFDCKPFIFRSYLYTRSIKEQGECNYSVYKKLINSINEVKSKLTVNDHLIKVFSLMQLGIEAKHYSDIIKGITKIQPKPNLTKLPDDINEDFIKSITGKIITTTFYHDLSMNVIVSDMVNNNKIVMMSADAFIKQFLGEHLILMQALKQFSEIYKDDQEIVKSRNLWLLYNKVH